jgi:hypothetical protein
MAVIHRIEGYSCGEKCNNEAGDGMIDSRILHHDSIGITTPV